MSKINLVLTSDNNYAQHLGVTIVSILENSSEADKLDFHIIENGIDEENKNKILSLKDKYKANINLYNLDISKLKDFPSIGHLSQAAYIRLFIPEILPNNIEKVLYLDSDLVCLKDIKLLYEQDLNNFPLAAIEDEKGKQFIRNYFYPGLKSYFNSGVMLIDVNKWRRNNISQKATEFIKKYQDKIVTADQDILNCLYKNNWQALEKRFNLDTKYYTKIKEDTTIFHYTGEIKPWNYLYPNKNKKYYWYYLKLSPWSEYKYTNKSFSNLIKRYILQINKEFRNTIRPYIPQSILDKRRKRFETKKIERARAN
ncbi:MAG: glycosyltransferase family 8 protein [Parcubacteria group bacterium]